MSLPFPAGTAWAAVRAVAGRELRRGWAGLVVLGLLAGFAGAVATGAMVVERRTATAESRLRAAIGVEDLRVMSLGNPLPDAAGIGGISRQWRASVAVGRLEGGRALNYLAVLSGPPHPGIFNPVVVQGRPVAPGSLDEVQVAESLASQAGIGVGATVRLKFLSPAQADDWNTGIGEPQGPVMSFRVVGLTRITPKSSDGVGMMASPAFHQRYGTGMAQGGVLMLQARDGVGAGTIAARLSARAKANTLSFDYSSREAAPVRTAAHILTGGALSFLVVAGLAGVIALAQFTSRHHSAGVGNQNVERILGLTRGERVLGHAAPSLLSAVLAALGAVTGGVAAGFVEPLGLLRTSEPYPGFRLNVTVIATGALLTAALVVLTSVVTAGRATVQRAGTRSPRRSLRLRRTAVLSAGSRLALGGGRGSLRLVSAAAGVTIAVAGMLASVSVAHSLGNLVASPHNWGANADLSIADSRPELIDRLRADPRIAALTSTTVGRTRIAGRDVVTYAQEFVTGRLSWTMVEGREPRDDAEVALGSRLATTLDAVPGDRLPLQTRHGPETVTVTGIGIGPFNGEAFGDNALFTPGGLLNSSRTTPYYNLDVKLGPRADVGAFTAELAKDWEVVPASRPAEVTSLGDLGRLPLFLAAFFVAVGVAALTHSTVLMVSRGRRELAVLHTIGFTRTQLAASLLVATAVTTVAGLVLGVPLGLAVGRLVWWEVAEGVGVVPDVQLPVLVALVTVPAALLIAALLAAVPTVRAGRHPLRTAPRTE